MIKVNTLERLSSRLKLNIDEKRIAMGRKKTIPESRFLTLYISKCTMEKATITCLRIVEAEEI
jgi:hypothetical protein